MTLQRKTLLIFGISFLCLLATLYATASYIGQASIMEAERDAARHRLHSARGLIEQKVTQFSSRFADWAAWDDAADFVKNGNAHFIESNLVDESLLTLNIHTIIFLNAAGQPVFATGFDTEKKRKTPVPEAVKKLLKDPALTSFKSVKDSHEGLFLVGERPMLLALRPIVTTQLKGPPRGTFIVGRYINEEEMRQLGEWGGVSLTLYQINDPQLSADFQVAKTELLRNRRSDLFTNPLSADQLSAYSLLRDIQGKPTLILQAIMMRDAYARGQQNLRNLMLALFIAAIVFALVTLVSLRHLVLQPLSNLSDEVHRVREGGNPRARVAVAGEKELAQLAGSINEMLAALEHSQTTMHESITELERRSHELALVGEMGGMLQSCRTREEAVGVIVQSLRRLFTEEIGALCVMNSSQDRVEVMLSWDALDEADTTTDKLDEDVLEQGNREQDNLKTSHLSTQPYFFPR